MSAHRTCLLVLVAWTGCSTDGRSPYFQATSKSVRSDLIKLVPPGSLFARGFRDIEVEGFTCEEIRPLEPGPRGFEESSPRTGAPAGALCRLVNPRGCLGTQVVEVWILVDSEPTTGGEYRVVDLAVQNYTDEIP